MSDPDTTDCDQCSAAPGEYRHEADSILCEPCFTAPECDRCDAPAQWTNNDGIGAALCLSCRAFEAIEGVYFATEDSDGQAACECGSVALWYSEVRDSDGCYVVGVLQCGFCYETDGSRLRGHDETNNPYPINPGK